MNTCVLKSCKCEHEIDDTFQRLQWLETSSSISKLCYKAYRSVSARYF